MYIHLQFYNISKIIITTFFAKIIISSSYLFYIPYILDRKLQLKTKKIEKQKHYLTKIAVVE